MFPRRQIRRNKKGGKNGLTVQMKPGSQVKIPQQMSLWSQPRRFVVQDDTERTIKSQDLSDVIDNYTFNIIDSPYLTAQAGLFMEYRIDSIRFIYKPLISQVTASYAATAPSAYVVPELTFSYWPYASVPSTYGEVAQRGDSIVASVIEPWQVTFNPVPLVRAYDSLTSDGYMNLGRQWITTDRKNVPHYGFTVALRPTQSTPSPTFGGTVQIYYTVDYRFPKQDGISKADRKQPFEVEEHKEASTVNPPVPRRGFW